MGMRLTIPISSRDMLDSTDYGVTDCLTAGRATRWIMDMKVRKKSVLRTSTYTRTSSYEYGNRTTSELPVERIRDSHIHRR
eukprot:scaffold62404_cov15-Prasinocladus_malaysianus.AAC.1